MNMHPARSRPVSFELAQKGPQGLHSQGVGVLRKAVRLHEPPEHRLGVGVVPQGGRGAAAGLKVEEKLLPEFVGGHTSSF
ncbi:hypothetical protein QR90_11835 [Deinococcus radiopugnans]|uniref:Uncharacterized protein n=1 Tax=Deinococcus radiopugnans TaxID=57497 RepID=A0A0A7KHF5_9DEIO|nr:hypothetical protein [Deinococcus radiopugnans]AIZ45622.1 hypothetical protein QR90_11835 [Deinococcus radiopugnans]